MLKILEKLQLKILEKQPQTAAKKLI